MQASLLYHHWLRPRTAQLTLIYLHDPLVHIRSERLTLSCHIFFPLLVSRLPLLVKKVEKGQSSHEITEAQKNFLENSLDQNVCLTSYTLYLLVSDPSYNPEHIYYSHSE